MQLFQALKCFVATPILSLASGYTDDPSAIASNVGCGSIDLFHQAPGGQLPLDDGPHGPGQIPFPFPPAPPEHDPKDGHHGEHDGLNWSTIASEPYWGPVVPLLGSDRSSSLIVNISVGSPSQHFNLDMSFTSLYTWVLDSACLPGSLFCPPPRSHQGPPPSRATFNRTESSNFRSGNITGADWQWDWDLWRYVYPASPQQLFLENDYVVKGDLGLDTIQLGNTSVVNATLLDVFKVEGSETLLAPGVSGALGLGRPQLQQGPELPTLSLFTSLSEQLNLTEVSATVSLSNGTLSIGGNFSSSAYSTQFNVTGVERHVADEHRHANHSGGKWYNAPEGQYWQVGLSEVWLGDEKAYGGSSEFEMPKRAVAIIDPNTYGYVFTPSIAFALRDALSWWQISPDSEHVHCSAMPNMPTLRFVLGSSEEGEWWKEEDNTYILAPEDYLQPIPWTRDECRPLFVSSEVENSNPGVETILLGVQFLRRFDVAYSYSFVTAQAHIGLSPAVSSGSHKIPGPPPPPGSSNATSIASSIASTATTNATSTVPNSSDKPTSTSSGDVVDITPINPSNAAKKGLKGGMDASGAAVIWAITAIGAISFVHWKL